MYTFVLEGTFQKRYMYVISKSMYPTTPALFSHNIYIHNPSLAPR